MASALELHLLIPCTFLVLLWERGAEILTATHWSVLHPTNQATHRLKYHSAWSRLLYALKGSFRKSLKGTVRLVSKHIDKVFVVGLEQRCRLHREHCSRQRLVWRWLFQSDTTVRMIRTSIVISRSLFFSFFFFFFLKKKKRRKKEPRHWWCTQTWPDLGWLASSEEKWEEESQTADWRGGLLSSRVALAGCYCNCKEREGEIVSWPTSNP